MSKIIVMSDITIYSKERMFKMLTNVYVSNDSEVSYKIKCVSLMSNFDISSASGRRILTLCVCRYIIDYFQLDAEVSLKLSEEFVEYIFEEYKMRLLSL